MSEMHSEHGERPWVLRKPVLLALTAILIVGAVVYWGLIRTADDDNEVLTARVERGDIVNTVTALGNLQPSNYVDVGAQVSGQLEKLHVEIGDTVDQGGLLAEIDAVVLQAKVESTRAQLAAQRAQLVDREAQVLLAEDKYQRQVQLKAEDATSEEAFQSAKATLDSAKAQLDALRAQIQQTESTLKGDSATLGYSRIYAPIAGTVVSISAREGQTLNANQVAPIILRIADLSTMTVWTQVSEADVPKLRVGMDAYFSTLGNPDRRWTGRLRQILPTPELVNNVVLYTALFDVDNPDGELKTQMSAQVFFVVDAARDVVTVPVSALRPWVPPAVDTSSEEAPVARSASADRLGVDAAPPGERPGSARSEGFAGSGPGREGAVRLREGAGAEMGGLRRAAASGMQPRAHMVTVIDQTGRQSERRVVVGASNRVMAEVLEGLTPGDVVITGHRAASTPAQQGNRQFRGGGVRVFP